MSYNVNNFGVVSGRLTADPQFFPNSDGSVKVRVTVAAPDNYKRNGVKNSQFIPLEAFITADKAATGHGVYDLMHQGDKILAQYTLKNNNYTDKNTNQPVYGLVLQIDNVSLEESKAVTDARQAARRTAPDAAAPAMEAPAQA